MRSQGKGCAARESGSGPGRTTPRAHAAAGLTSFHLSCRRLIFSASRDVRALELSTVTGRSEPEPRR